MPARGHPQIREVAGYLKVAERTLYRLLQEGTLPAFKVGNSWRSRRKDLERWILEQSRGASTPDREDG